MSSEGHILGREGTLSIRGLPHLSHAASGTFLPPPSHVPIYDINISGPVLPGFLPPLLKLLALLSHPSS